MHFDTPFPETRNGTGQVDRLVLSGLDNRTVNQFQRIVANDRTGRFGFGVMLCQGVRNDMVLQTAGGGFYTLLFLVVRQSLS